jgi:hypothetical protein
MPSSHVPQSDNRVGSDCPPLLQLAPLLALALAPALHRVALSSAGFASSSDTAGKLQPQYLAPATILTARNTVEGGKSEPTR